MCVAAQLVVLDAACLAVPKQAAPKQAAPNQAAQNQATLRVAGVNAACPSGGSASRRTSLVERQRKPGPGEQTQFLPHGMYSILWVCIDIHNQDVTLLACPALTSSCTNHLP